MIVRAALSLLALRIGTSIAYPSIDSELAGISTTTGSGTSIFDATNIMAGISGFVSAFFGGAPLEPIITGTAAAPNPVISGSYNDGYCRGDFTIGFHRKSCEIYPNSGGNRVLACARSL